MYTRTQLIILDTIEQSWDGAELKIQEDNKKVWLNPRENAKYDGDYTIETYVDGRWEGENFYF